MTPAFRNTVLWATGSALMAIFALTSLSASYSDGQYLPANGDAFYHARRILDSLMTGAPVVQFDARMHVPEGSWITWPWGYDTLLTGILALLGPFASEAQANRVLMNIPVAAVPMAVALVVIIARQLALPFGLSVLFVLGFASLPLVYMLFAVGNIDHHFAELMWLLMTLSAGIWFFRPERLSYGAAITLGSVLGSAIAIHNGLFILQIPVAAIFGLRWLRRESLPDRRQVRAFSATLLLVALASCIPSEPWRRGFFEFYTLSWFHLYIAACVALFSLLLTSFEPTRTRALLFSLAAIVAALPLAGAWHIASQFVAGDLESIQGITEALSPYELHARYGESLSTRFFSWLLWLALPMVVVNVWWVYRRREASLQFVALSGALGLALMQTQYRFGVFGITFLLITPLLAVAWLCEWRPAAQGWLVAGCCVSFAIAYVPTAGNWTPYWAQGGNDAYPYIRSVFPILKQACKDRPGVVLSDPDGGHWVLYHSNCTVIANVFLLTPQHAAKSREAANLLMMTPEQLLANNRSVRYVFAHHSLRLVATSDPAKPELPDLEQFRGLLKPLERNLLGPPAAIPPQFKLIWQVTTEGGQTYGRLFEIVRTP